jgi:plastocyanin
MSKFVIAALTLAAMAGTALAGGGKISGSVEARPAKYLKDTIVYVKEAPGAKTSPKTFEIDQKGMSFAPHISLAVVGDTVKFQNHDNVDHNVMSPEGHYDLGVWGMGKTKTFTFKSQGVFSQVCKIHPEMLAYVFVGQNRFSAVVDGSGNFTIADVPPGSYELDVWNPKLKAAPQKITVTAGGTTNAHFALAR